MQYLIDFDTRSVEAKGEDGEVLASYILDNDLNIAVALIDSESELISQFSLPELQELYNNLADDHGERARSFDNEDDAAEFIWLALENNQSSLPTFTQSLGKKLLKAGKSRSKDTVEPTSTKPKRERKVKSSTRVKDDTMVCLGAEPKSGTLPHIVWSIVDDNLGEMSIADIIADGGDAKQITRCLRKGFLIRQEEEL